MSGGRAGQRGLPHIPALDGLRGLSIAAVLLFHGGVAWATGGFLGVDVFFVLSGFLITSLLLAEHRTTGSIGLGGFWSRRARRLLPALLVVVAATAAASQLFDPSSRGALRGDALAAVAYVANWRFVAQGASYFGRTSATSPLNHLWSLAIEEQFYLVWPLVVLVVARGRRAATWVGGVAGVGVLASIVTMVLLHRSGASSTRLYYGTDSRASTVLIGAVLAAALAPRMAEKKPSTAASWPRPMRLLLGLAAGLAAVDLVAGVALVDGNPSWLYAGGLPLFSLAAAVVIGHSVLLPGGLLGRLLALRPLVEAGRLSYALYLWHWPLYLLVTGARTGLGGAGLLGVRLAATTAAALASDRLLERPIRRGRPAPAWSRLLAPVAVAATVVVVLGATTGLRGGLTTGADAALAANLLPVPRTEQIVAAPLPAPPPTATARTRSPGDPVRVLVLGDSVGLTLAEGLVRPAGSAHIVLGQAAILGCGVARGGPVHYVGQEQAEPAACPTWPDQWRGAVQAQHPDVALVVIGRWEVVDRFHDGRWAHLGEPEFDGYIRAELEQAVAAADGAGARVALATAPYYSRGERPDGGRWPEDDPARVDRLNELVREVAAEHPDVVSVIDLGAKTAKDGAYARSLEGVQLRYDGVHFTPSGVRWLAPWLLPQLTALGPPVVVGSPSTTTPPTATTAVAAAAPPPTDPAPRSRPGTRARRRIRRG